MALFKHPDPIEALDDLLDRERVAVLRGDLNTLVRMAPEKERLLSRLAGASGTPGRFARLREKADRNQHLLTAVANGIDQARRRLKRGREAPAPGLSTYSAGGERSAMGQRRSTLEKRA